METCLQKKQGVQKINLKIMSKDFWKWLSMTERERAMRDLIFNNPEAVRRIRMAKAKEKAHEMMRRSEIRRMKKYLNYKLF